MVIIELYQNNYSKDLVLFETLEDIAQPIESLYPMKMEELGQNVGYLLYRTQAEWDADKERVRVIDGRDRMQLFVDGNFITTHLYFTTETVDTQAGYFDGEYGAC